MAKQQRSNNHQQIRRNSTASSRGDNRISVNSVKMQKQRAKTKDTDIDPVVDTPAQASGTAGPINDPAWYAANPALLRDAASLSFNVGTGNRTYFLEDLDGGFQVVGNELHSVPGLCSIYYVPGIGWSDSANSPINVMANSIYTFVRHANSGHSNYEKQDYVMYLMAMDSLYSFVAWMRRLYGYMPLYSQYNRYTPEGLMYQNSVNFDDLRAHIVDLRFYINQFMYKLGSYVIPNDLPLQIRHMWLCSNLYLDEPSVKAQMYQYVPEGFYKYNELDGPGKLEWTPLTSNFTILKFEDIIAYGDALLDAVVSSEDMAIMSGDTLKAFGDRIFMMTALDENYMVLPTYSAEVLDQIHNLTAVGELNNLDIDQVVSTDVNGSYVRWRPVLRNKNSVELADRALVSLLHSGDLLDVTTDDISPAVCMVASRLKSKVEWVELDDVTEDQSLAGVTCCGSEIVTHFTTLRLQYTPTAPHGYAFVEQSFETWGIGAASSYRRPVWSLSAFNKTPFVADVTVSADLLNFKDYHFEINNWTLLEYPTLKRMHEVAIMSMLRVPVLGLYQQIK